jgi:hypothetical protein
LFAATGALCFFPSSVAASELGLSNNGVILTWRSLDCSFHSSLHCMRVIYYIVLSYTNICSSLDASLIEWYNIYSLKSVTFSEQISNQLAQISVDQWRISANI